MQLATTPIPASYYTLVLFLVSVGQEPALSNITIGIGMQEPAQTTNSLILPFMDFC